MPRSNRQQQPRSNDEVINDLMVFGNPMKQLVIVEAITRYVDSIAEAGLEETRRQFGENSFINPSAWFACAAEIKAALDQHLNR
jgi:hypothetical protein